MNKGRLLCRIILTALSILAVGFIWYNSLKNADDSAESSGRIMAFLNGIFDRIGLPEVSEHIVRKSAHFVEFFTLGGLLSLTALSYTPRIRRALLFALSAGLLTAAVDESIQRFSAGRSGEFKDVLLDFCGVLCASLIVTLVAYLIKRKKEKVYE